MRPLLLWICLALPVTGQSLPALVDRVQHWLGSQGYQVAPQLSANQAVWEYQLHSAEVDVTQYFVDHRPNRPRRYQQKAVPQPGGFRIEVNLSEFAPDILTQPITSQGPEKQRFLQRDRLGRLLSTVLWFSPQLPLIYTVEYGTDLSDRFAYDLQAALDE